MSTYAQQVDFENFVAGWVTTDPVALERLLREAERDIDHLIQPLRWRRPPSQVITVSGAAGGSFILSFQGVATGPIAWNASAADIQSALQALPAIGTKVTVVGTGPWTAVWDADWARTNFTVGLDVPTLVANGSALTPATGQTPLAYVVQVEGLRLNPLEDLTANQAIVLARATCAQAEYRNKMGPDFFIRPQFSSVQGPDFTTRGKLPPIGPKVLRELAGSGMLLKGGRATASYGRIGVGIGRPNY